MLRFNVHFMKEHLGASNILWKNSINIQQLHPKRYANGLIVSWNHDKSKMIFPFLLTQADQGDLEEAKKGDTYVTKIRIP